MAAVVRAVVVGRAWVDLGSLWALLGFIFAGLRSIVVPPGPVWAHLVAMLSTLGGSLGYPMLS